MINKINTAIIGCGMISKTYLKSLQQFQILEVTACCDLDEERASSIAELFSIKKMTFDEILSDVKIQFIINLTNPNAHYLITKKALEAGKHVYSEKMLSVTLEEGKELCEIAKEKRLRLGVAPDTFLGGSIQTARYMIEHELIGEVTSAVISVNRDYFITGDILPHLNKLGGGIAFDVGCYYLTAIASILGTVEKVTGFAKINRAERVNQRVGTPLYQQETRVEENNVTAAALQFSSGVLATVHFNSESIVDEMPHLELYGTKGIIIMGDPNTFDAPVYLKKMLGEKVLFPFTHGYTRQARGIGAAEMGWAMQENRPHRASMEMAYHILEIVNGIMISAKEEKTYHMKSGFTLPQSLPEGYLDIGEWGPVEERAII